MTLNPGSNETTWQPAWNNGKTKTIRVPVLLADKILEYARLTDSSPGAYEQAIILQALENYIEWKRQNYHPNQHSKSVNTSTRAWDEFRKFRKMIINGVSSTINGASSTTNPAPSTTKEETRSPVPC